MKRAKSTKNHCLINLKKNNYDILITHYCLISTVKNKFKFYKT